MALRPSYAAFSLSRTHVMNRTPLADWQHLSALYEVAVALDPVSLAAWLARLRAQAHPLFSQLEQMLAARAEVERNDFLSTLPKMPLPLDMPADGPSRGDRIGPYRLERRLGEGGMAEVWMAQRDDGAFQRTVAIKLLFRTAASTQRDSFAQRFARERDILASLDHPHIARLHDAGVTPGGQPWLALEYVEGATLTRWCDAQRLGITERVRLFRQVLLAVQHAHANLVIHRDLKPGNILVTSQGEVRLLDFGIAKLMEAQGGPMADTELTRVAGRPMTPHYAAPEQLLGQPLTTACDVYALGVVLYELLCGERPYELKLDSAAQLEQSILEVEPRAPSRRTLTVDVANARNTTVAALPKTLATDLDAIVLRALAKQPARRYASVEAFRADLDCWLAGEPVQARVPSAAYRMNKFVRRHRWAVALSAAAVLSLIGVTMMAVAMGLQARDDSARAGAARDFMLGLFKRADQEKARGADITAKELLETARADLLTRLAQQPRLQAELLQGIGTIQRDMGEYVGADGTFADAARVYKALDMPREAALALSEEANAAVRMGNIKLAERAIQQARDTPKRPRSNPQLEARMSEVEGWIAVIKGETGQAKALFERSHEQAMKSFGPHADMTLDALRGRIFAEQRLANFNGALTLLEQLETATADSGAGDARQSTALAIDRAELLQVAGRYAELRDHVMAALPRCVSALGRNHEHCRKLAVRQAAVALRLGMTGQASESWSMLEAIAEDRTAPALGTDALLLMLGIGSAHGDASMQSATVARVKALVESNAGALLNKNYKIKAMLALAEAALRMNDAAGAQQWARAARDLQRIDAGPGPATVPGAVAQSLEGISLLNLGQAAEALGRLRGAQEDLARLIGTDHPATQLCALNVALTLDRLGRPGEALAIAAHAEPILGKAMGGDAPTYQRVKRLRDRLAQTAASAGPAAARQGHRVAEPSPMNRHPAPDDFFG